MTSDILKEISRRKLDWKELTPYEFWTSSDLDYLEITFEDGSKQVKSFLKFKEKK